MPKDANQPTILITGSNGFLGQAIAHRLRDRYRVIGLDLSPPKGRSETEETINLDITSDTSVREAIETARKRSSGRIASVIHLAAYYDTTGKDNPKYDAVNVEGTRRLLKALQDLPTEQFIYASTLLVQAPSPAKATRINENSPLDPAWAYPKSKAETEAVIEGARRDQDSDPPSRRGL